MIDRRNLLAAAAALGAAGPVSAQPPARPTPTGLREAARDAYVFGLPLLEFARVRNGALAAGLKSNTFQHRAVLADHTARTVTTPNNDTVYSTAFLDLRGGPVTLTLPPTGERYLSVALMDAYTDNFAVLGTRTSGVKGGRFTIIGPGGLARLPAGVRQGEIVQSPTPWVWALGRTLVDGPADLAAAAAVQRAITLGGGGSGPAPERTAPRDAQALAVLTAIHKLMRENPPRPQDAAAVARIRPALMDYEIVRLTAEASAALAAGVEDARALLRKAGGLGGAGGAIQGWTYPRASLGDFGTEYAYRAAVAVNGLAALPNAEAMYMRPLVNGQGVFPAGSNYRLRFGPGQLPPLRRPGGFWSLTMYEADPAGQFWLADNPLHRYAIGDRTPGLKRGANGALDILIGPRDPGPALRANWLPAPAGKPWTVVMRTYLPQPALLEGRYRLPALTPA